MELLEALNWRYSAKRMNGKKMPEDQLEQILEAVRLSPTSLGLQPFRVFVIEDSAIKEQIAEKACAQPQIIESSHLLVFAIWENVEPAYIDRYVSLIARTRNLETDSLVDFKNMVNGYVERAQQAGQVQSWLAKQAYIAMGIGTVAAASLGVDATPLEGFSASALDQVLGLKEKGLKSVVMLALGYRDEENDYLSAAPKVRVPAEELFVKY